MNLHDFVTESFNPEHIFRYACTVSFCLTTDHISTCLMMSSARFKTAQFWSVLTRGEWMCSICSYQRRWCGSTGTENWYGRARVETWQLPWCPMDERSLDTGLGGRHGSWQRMQWYAPVSQCLDSWQRMQWYATSHSVTTAGQRMQWYAPVSQCLDRLGKRMPVARNVSRQLVTDAVVCNVSRCHDSW